CEEHNKFGGLGESVSRLLVTEYLVPQEFVAVNDSFGESGTPDQLMTKYKLDPVDIVAAAQKAISRRDKK
ncbi:MAG: transketolase family protein, partial [Pedobacter sp.]|nr:transketolase family protein [Pedobacter sp.]